MEPGHDTNPLTRFVRILASTISDEQLAALTTEMTEPQALALNRALEAEDDARTIHALFALGDRLGQAQRLKMFAALAPEQRTQVVRLVELLEKAQERPAVSTPDALVTRLLGAIRGPTVVERRSYPGAEELYARYWETSTPVVLTDFTQGWPALGKWTHAYLREHHGDALVDVVEGRDADPDHPIHTEEHTRERTLGGYLDAIEASGPGDDRYMVGVNRNLERESLRPLLADMTPPEDLIERAANLPPLWIGPAGTLTPLHHDQSNILFCQVVGRKRIWLAPPWSTRLAAPARGLWNRYEPQGDPEGFARAHGTVIEVAAGDSLFIPVGWWHQVQALEPSISVSLTAFTRPNVFDWFLPGA